MKILWHDFDISDICCKYEYNPRYFQNMNDFFCSETFECMIVVAAIHVALPRCSRVLTYPPAGQSCKVSKKYCTKNKYMKTTFSLN